jgi:hypothetical protein
LEASAAANSEIREKVQIVSDYALDPIMRHVYAGGVLASLDNTLFRETGRTATAFSLSFGYVGEIMQRRCFLTAAQEITFRKMPFNCLY